MKRYEALLRRLREIQQWTDYKVAEPARQAVDAIDRLLRDVSELQSAVTRCQARSTEDVLQRREVITAIGDRLRTIQAHVDTCKKCGDCCDLDSLVSKL